MQKIKIGIDNIRSIYLHSIKDMLRINDYINDGVIECKIKDLRKTIQIIEDAYRNKENLSSHIRGSSGGTVNLSSYQDSIGKRFFQSNYIVISHLPTIIKMLKSVKIEKEKYILDNDSLFALCINDLEYLNQTMRRRRKVLTDNNGCKYIEV